MEGLIDAIILGEGEQPLLALAQILKEWEVRSSKVGENRNNWVLNNIDLDSLRNKNKIWSDNYSDSIPGHFLMY